jgi:hypothetical protein
MAIDGLGTRAAASLSRLADQVSKIRHTEKLNFECAFNDLKGYPLRNLKTDIEVRVGPDCLSIYEFRFCTNTSASELKRLITDARMENKEGRAFARVNIKHDGDQCSLYIGSSRKTSRRLAEHLGLGSAKTYSLQLCHWATPLSGMLEIVVYRFKASQDNFRLIPTLEDQLSDELKPLLGRKGRL